MKDDRLIAVTFIQASVFWQQDAQSHSAHALSHCLPLLPNLQVHGEQFLLSNAAWHGETALLRLAVSAAPCGHCRQLYSELACAVGFWVLANRFVTVHA